MLTYFRAFFKCIPNVSWRAGAGRNVVEDPALGIDATSSRAGVDTFVFRASHLPRAIRV